LKSLTIFIPKGATYSRFPQGKRGLKYTESYKGVKPIVSLPAREAWIEMPLGLSIRDLYCSRFPQGKRGLKSLMDAIHYIFYLSLPAREAWIEI